jgi:hypothetical protein
MARWYSSQSVSCLDDDAHVDATATPPRDGRRGALERTTVATTTMTNVSAISLL